MRARPGSVRSPRFWRCLTERVHGFNFKFSVAGDKKSPAPPGFSGRIFSGKEAENKPKAEMIKITEKNVKAAIKIQNTKYKHGSNRR